MPEATILVVDDEPAVRAFVKRLLEQRGYQVLEAGSGEEALHILSQELSRIALLLTDIMMPGIRGTELAEEACNVLPALPVLFMSGYCDCLTDSLNGYDCVQKPFKPEDLLNQVGNMLKAKLKTAHGRT
jgi:CheY-like chemotaxis protein